MKIVVLNGSPKGSESVTYHNVLYLEKHFQDVQFEYVHVAKFIKKYDEDITSFKNIMDKIESADLVMFIYPVYTFLVPFQLMRFIELVINRGFVHAFDNKYVTQLSTSKHFFDITAYNYLHELLEGFNMKHIHGHMADMNDMLKVKGRKQLIDFFEAVEDTVNKERYVIKKYKQKQRDFYPFKYDGYDKTQKNIEKNASNIVVIYNGHDYSSSIRNMITYLEDNNKYYLHKIDLSNIKVDGGCLGCLRCTISGHCIYNDDFENIHRKKILTSDMIIYASDINNHWMDAEFKKFDDRTFYNGHKVSMNNKAVAYLLSGSLRNEHNLREVLEARADVSGMYLLDIVTDEDEDTILKLDLLNEKIEYYMLFNPERPASFFGIGGMKIFRDVVYEMRSLMVEDHKFFKREKLYDFPKRRFIINTLLIIPAKLLKRPKIIKKIAPKLSKYLISMYKKVIEKY